MDLKSAWYDATATEVLATFVQRTLIAYPPGFAASPNTSTTTEHSTRPGIEIVPGRSNQMSSQAQGLVMDARSAEGKNPQATGLIPNPPKGDELYDRILKVQDALDFIADVGWHSPMSVWIITSHWRTLLEPEAPATTICDDENGDNELRAAEAARKPEDDNDNDTEGNDNDQDEDGDMGEGPAEPSQIMDAHARTENVGVAGQRPNMVDEFVYWLRLVSAPIYHAKVLYEKPLSAKIANVHFMVVDHPPPSEGLQPWREVIHSMYDKFKAREIIADLMEENPADSIFNNEDFESEGTVHREAILAMRPREERILSE